MATAWLAEISSVPLTKIRRVVVSAPWLAVAAQIGGAFSVPGGRGPEILYPDQIFGWQPFLSLIFTLYQTDLPALFVYTGRYPEVHFAAVWS